MVDGEAVVGAPAVGRVDVERRRAISRAHTATHLIHRAFREALGDTATQMGSENAPGRLRFDFPSATAVAPAVLADVEARVNEVLAVDLPVSAHHMSQDQARSMGAMALFGEKYGDVVRVVSVGDWAHELCGGTHARSSGQVGVVKFLSEGSIGAGVRRVEALVGTDAYRFLAREHILLAQLSDLVKARPEELPERVESLVLRLKDAERELARMRSASLTANLDGLIGEGTDIGAYRVWTFRVPGRHRPAGDLRDLALRAKGLARPEIPVLMIGAAVTDGRVSLVAVTQRPRARGRAVGEPGAAGGAARTSRAAAAARTTSPRAAGRARTASRPRSARCTTPCATCPGADRRCAAACGSGSTSAAAGSASPAATRTASWPCP